MNQTYCLASLLAAVPRLLAVAIATLTITGTAQAASYTWTNSSSGASGYWTNGILWGQAADTTYPTNLDSAYLTNSIISGAYTNIYDYAPGLGGPLANLVINSGGGAGQAWLLVTNATLVATNFIGSGGVLQIDSGGVVTNRATANINWWTGTTGTIYLNSGGTYFTANAVTIGNAISNVNATVTTLSPTGQGGTWNFNAQALTVGSGAATGNVLTVSGVTLTNLTTVTVGASGGRLNTMTVTNATVRSTAVTVGGTSNTVSVLANSTWNQGGGVLTVGNAGAIGNVLLINGGIVTNLGNQSRIGDGANAKDNSVIITNGGRLFTGSEFYIGMNGGSNSQLIVNNGTVSGGHFRMGNVGGGSNLISVVNGGYVSGSTLSLAYQPNSSYNTVVVEGTNAAGNKATIRLELSTVTLSVGGSAGSHSNRLLIGNGGIITNISSTVNLTVGGGGFGNSLVITNGGELRGTTAATIGNGGTMNSALVAGGLGTTSIWFHTGQLTIGSGTAISNSLTVGAGGIVTGIGGITAIVIGSGATSRDNSLIITNGGQLLLTGASNKEIHLGAGGAFNSRLIVDNGTFSGAGVILVGRGTGSATAGGSNLLSVVNGGYVQAVRIDIGGGGTSNNYGTSNNVVRVAGTNAAGNKATVVLAGTLIAGMTEPNAPGNYNLVEIGNGGIITGVTAVTVGQDITIGNRLVITNGGQLFSTTASTIGNIATNNSALVVGGSGSTSLWRHVNSLTVGNGAAIGNSLTVGTGGVVTGLTTVTIGAGAARSNELVLAGGSLFATSLTVSNVGNRVIVNSGTLSVASGIVVANGGALSGTGTVASAVNVRAGGILDPGNSIGILTVNSLTLTNGTLLNWELAATNASDQVVVLGTLNLGGLGAAWSDFTWSTNAGFGEGVYTLIDAATLSGNLGNGTNGTIYGYNAYLWQDTTANNLMLTVIPEPNSLTLVLMGLASGMMVWSKRRRS